MTFALVLLAVFGATLLGLELLCRCAPFLGLLDKPDAVRKLQKKPVPVVGGIVACAVFACALVLCQRFALIELDGSLATVVGLCCLVAAIGALDDRLGLSGPIKSAFEILPIALTVAALVPHDRASLFGSDFFVSEVVFVLWSSVWIFGCVNSFNLLDGADGFVGTLGATVLVATSVVAFGNGDGAAGSTSLLFAAAVVGFLVLNAPPAKAYFGDAGSLALGFLVGSLALRAFVVDGSFRPAPAVCLVALPIFDSLCAVARRRNVGRSVFSPDLEHLHHSLRRRFGSRGALVALLGLQTPLALASIFGARTRNDAIPFATLVVVLGVMLAFNLFGRNELHSTFLRASSFFERIFARSRYDARGRLLGARDSQQWRAFWRAFLRAAQDADCVLVRLNLNLPFVGIDWQGEWRGKPLKRDEASPLFRKRAKRAKPKAKSSAVKFEIPLRLDSVVVGTLCAHFDARAHEFRDCVERVEPLLGLCADALLPYGESFEVDSPVFVRNGATALNQIERDARRDVKREKTNLGDKA